MHQKLFKALNQLVSLNSQQQEELSRLVNFQEFPKDTILLNLGEIPNYLHFLVEGTVRAISYQENKEITVWFGFEGDYVCSYYSFVSRQPSDESIIAMSDCKLLSISYTALQGLYEKDMAWNKLGRLITEQYYVEYKRRILSLQSMSATERYDQLIEEHPAILNQVKLGHLASYLGITQETLSRIRSGRDKRQRIHHKIS